MKIVLLPVVAVGLIFSLIVAPIAEGVPAFQAASVRPSTAQTRMSVFALQTLSLSTYAGDKPSSPSGIKSIVVRRLVQPLHEISLQSLMRKMSLISRWAGPKTPKGVGEILLMACAMPANTIITLEHRVLLMESFPVKNYFADMLRRMG